LSIVQKGINVSDKESYDISRHFEECFEFIEKAKDSNERVLVHCAMGASRSVAVVCGYLIAAHGLLPAQALELVRARRAAAAPNRGFVDQLHEYHRSLAQGGLGAALE